MDQFVTDYLPFWIVQFGLAMIGWTCLGRFLLGFFVHQDSRNYIWRWFRLLTDHACAACAFLTPRAVPGILIPPLAALWIFMIRALAFVLMHQAGLAPTLPGAVGG